MSIDTLVYRDELIKAMEMLAQDERTIFIGQTVAYPGSRFTYGTLEKVPQEKRIEMPVTENMQMGISAGLALAGYIPVSIYPRMDFLLYAGDQLVNHLDKLKDRSQGKFNPKVIIRAVIGGRNPYPGPQHCQDHTEAFKLMLTNVDVVRLDHAADIIPIYRRALESERSTLVIEQGDQSAQKK